MESIPRVDPALFVHLHFSALIVVELLPDGRLDVRKEGVGVNKRKNAKHCSLMLIKCKTQSTAERSSVCWTQ